MSPAILSWILTVSLLPQFVSSAQVTPQDSSKLSDFSSEPYLIRSAAVVVSMNADGTGTRTQTNTIVIHSDASARQLSVLSIAYASQSEHADFGYVRVTHSDGSIQETPVSSAVDQPAPVTQQAPFYSDLKVKQIPVRSLRVGDTLEWQALFTFEHPEAPSQFWFQQTFLRGPVVLSEDVELRVPATLHLVVWTNPRSKVSPVESTADGKHIYHWHTANLVLTTGPEAEKRNKAELRRRRTPEEELDIRKGELPSIAWSTFTDWAAVGEWYRSLAASRAMPDSAIRTKVADLTAGKATDLEKAQAVYTYVSTQIRYIGVAFGIGRYQPHTAAEVFANQYGDCKDKHTLLAAMLSILNLHADPVLVGAGIRFNSAVPSPSAFNHLITRLSLGGKEVWLDATAEAGAWGSLLNVIRDQDALVVTTAPPALLAHTPVDLPYPQSTTATVVGALDDSLTSESKIVFTLHDDSELYLRAALHNVSPSDYGAFVQQIMANYGFGGSTSEPVIDHLDDPSQPLQISFHYHRVKEKDWGDNRITAIFQPSGLPAYAPEEPPVSAIQLGAARTQTSRIELELPKGWTASPPADIHAHTPFAKCDVTYRLDKGKLIAERHLTILRKEIPASDYEQYQKWYDETDAGGVPYLQLFPPPKNVSVAAADPPKSPEVPSAKDLHADNSQANDFIMKGFASVRALDLDSARKSFDEANKLNPTQHGLWAGYAAVAEMLGKVFETSADLQHELAFHPEEVQFYRPLVQLQLKSGDTAAALATLHTWVKAAPDTPDASLALANQLQSMKRYNEALDEAQSAIARLESTKADLIDLRIVAANAQVSLGYMKEAAASVAPLLQGLQDPVKINDITYILAEAGSNLLDAEQAQARLLSKRDEESANWALSDDLRPKFAVETQISAEWDTMGWILYQEGKYSEALGYIEAAIHGISQETIHKHLLALATALHRPALAAGSGPKFRTITLGPANGRHGVAGFNFLVVDGRIIESSPTDDQSASTAVLERPEALLKSANLHSLFPPNSKVHLIRAGYLNCHSNTCELVLKPLP